MWADNETTEDFLNYEVHCDLIKEYITNPNLLPLTIGIFGDWGSGKSSIMKILEQKLVNDSKILTIYFNSWLFESYEDAKVSLLENILLELSKNETLSETAKKKILNLISRVDYMKLAKDGIKKYYLSLYLFNKNKLYYIVAIKSNSVAPVISAIQNSPI